MVVETCLAALVGLLFLAGSSAMAVVNRETIQNGTVVDGPVSPEPPRRAPPRRKK